MSRQNLIMIGAVVVVALVGFLVTGSAVIALLLLVIGVMGAVVLVKRQGEGNKRGAGKAFFEAPEAQDQIARSLPTNPPAGQGEGLPTWDAGQALPTWGGIGEPEGDTSYEETYETTSYSDGGYEETYEETSYTDGGYEQGSYTETYEETSYEGGGSYDSGHATESTGSDTSWGGTEDSWSSGGGESSWTGGDWGDEAAAEETAEEAPAANVTSLFGGGGRPAPINEEVSTADDIMEASKATELHLGGADDGDAAAPAGDDNSELAKLLAKVQARLAAYE